MSVLSAVTFDSQNKELLLVKKYCDEYQAQTIFNLKRK